MKERGSVGNAYAYLNSYNMLKSFNRDKPLHFTFSRIDADYLEIFEKWMRARGNKDTSKSFQMRTLRAVFNRTIKPEAVAREKNPFTDYKMSRFNTRTPKRSLSKADVMKIRPAGKRQIPDTDMRTVIYRVRSLPAATPIAMLPAMAAIPIALSAAP